MDANEDVRKGETYNFFRAAGMKEAILSSHTGRDPPATYNRNMNREPIDGLWVTQGLRVSASGYSAFNEGCPSDHRVLWIELKYDSAFGHHADPLKYKQPRRLKADDPRLVHKYNTLVSEKLLNSGLFIQLIALVNKAKIDGWSEALTIAYNKIQVSQIDIRKQAEKNIRKIRQGGISWSLKLQSFRNKIELWDLIYKKGGRKGKH